MKLEYKDEIKDFMGLFADDISRYIFQNRLMYNLLGEIKYLRKVILTNKIASIFLDKLLAEKTVAVWGVGIRAEKFIEYYPEVKIECLIDSYKSGQLWHGIKVISFKEFIEEHSDAKIVILPRFSHKEIEKEIKESGIKESRILNFAKVMEQLYENQYFDLPELKVSGEGIFVDGGSFDGNDSIQFVKKWGGRVQLWEPNIEVIPQIIKKMKENNVCYELCHAGMSNNVTNAALMCKGGEASATSLEESVDGDIPLDFLDNHMVEKVDMVKMDIEGFEYKALLGARRVIQRDHPILAICVYHKQEDIWEIPKLIHSICSEYKFYLRHYSLFQNETVLYAII